MGNEKETKKGVGSVEESQSPQVENIAASSYDKLLKRDLISLLESRDEEIAEMTGIAENAKSKYNHACERLQKLEHDYDCVVQDNKLVCDRNVKLEDEITLLQAKISSNELRLNKEDEANKLLIEQLQSKLNLTNATHAKTLAAFNDAIKSKDDYIHGLEARVEELTARLNRPWWKRIFS